MEQKRIFFLDFIRVFALFCIIWCHTNNIEYDSYFLEKAKWFFGKCGVPLFFMVSGYLAFPMNKSFGQFAKAKVGRVLFPFFVWVLIYAICELIQGRPIFLNGDILNEGSAHLWFIYVIMGLYLIVPIVDPFLKLKERKTIKLYLILWIITGLFPLLNYITSAPYNEHVWMYTLYHIYGYVGYFILGYYFKIREYETSLLRIRTSFMFIVISIVLIGIYYFVFDCSTVLVSDYKGLPIMLYSIAMFCILRKISIYVCYRNIIFKIITSLSVCSFGIYLIHMLVVMFIYPIIPVIDKIPDLVLTAMFVILNIAISYIVVYFFSKFKYSRYIFG